MKKIILASGSPRRKQILEDAGFKIEVFKQEVEESYSEFIPLTEIPLFLAQKKMDAAKILLEQDNIIITADTVVILENELIGKPKDMSDAKSILKKLSGKTHQVVSAVCITINETLIALSAKTNVTMLSINEEEIDFYLKTFQPLDKAGAYAIQEWIGLNKISKIEGDYYNVVGFPMHLIYPYLKDAAAMK